MSLLESFVINTPSDLLPFADALQEAGHRRWAGTVRRLAREGEWPKKLSTGNVTWGFSLSRFQLSFYQTITEAVWAVIHSGCYLEESP